MNLSPILKRFVDKAPLPVIMRAVLVPCEDGHAQERRLLGQIGPLVGAGQVWLADRNFCTEGFFNDLNQRGAYSLIR